MEILDLHYNTTLYTIWFFSIIVYIILEHLTFKKFKTTCMYLMVVLVIDQITGNCFRTQNNPVSPS